MKTYFYLTATERDSSDNAVLLLNLNTLADMEQVLDEALKDILEATPTYNGSDIFWKLKEHRPFDFTVSYTDDEDDLVEETFCLNKIHVYE